METSDFVRDKLTEWGFSEFIQRFEGTVLRMLSLELMTLKLQHNDDISFVYVANWYKYITVMNPM